MTAQSNRPFAGYCGQVHKKEGEANGGRLPSPGFEGPGGLPSLSVARAPFRTHGVGGAPGDATPAGSGAVALAPAHPPFPSGSAEGGHAGIRAPPREHLRAILLVTRMLFKT